LISNKKKLNNIYKIYSFYKFMIINFHFDIKKQINIINKKDKNNDMSIKLKKFVNYNNVFNLLNTNK